MNALLQIGLSNAVACAIVAMLLLPLAHKLQRPALTHAVSVLILVKLLTPPLFNVPLIRDSASGPTPLPQITIARATPLHGATRSSPAPAEAAEEHIRLPDDDAAGASAPRATSVSSIPSPRPQPARTWLSGIRKTTSANWRFWLSGCWIASSVLLGALTLTRIIRLALAVRNATVPAPDIALEVELLSKRLGIRRSPTVRFIAGTAPPMLMGALRRRPELLIPADLWDRLDHSQRQTLLLHELAHLRRGDHWVRYVELLATCVYWWHPAVWLARSALREAEEQCCDAWVVWAMPNCSRTYMTTLLDAIDFLSQQARSRLAVKPVLASGMGQFHNLQRRLAMVREQNVQRRLGGGGLAVVALLAAIVLPVGAKLARGDDRAQPAVTDAPPKAPALPDQQDRDRRKAAQAAEKARLESELESAQQNVERLRRQLDALTSRSADLQVSIIPSQPQAPAIAASRDQSRRKSARDNSRWATLGYVTFTYEDAGSASRVLAFDGRNERLMWTLNIPLNRDSVIRCYDNDTLLIKSADGYTRLVNVEDGQVTKAWAPGVEAPAAAPEKGVNPFGLASAPPFAQASVPDTARVAASPGPQDQEKRLERVEESVRMLTETVDRLAKELEGQRGSSAPAKP